MLNTNLLSIRNFAVIVLIAIIWQLLSKPVRKMVANGSE